jgi:hypothetical protein
MFLGAWGIGALEEGGIEDEDIYDTNNMDLSSRRNLTLHDEEDDYDALLMNKRKLKPSLTTKSKPKVGFIFSVSGHIYHILNRYSVETLKSFRMAPAFYLDLYSRLHP